MAKAFSLIEVTGNPLMLEGTETTLLEPIYLSIIIALDEMLYKKPLDENCDCFVCKNYTIAYIRYQLQQEEAVGHRLATFHNLYYLHLFIL